MNEPSEKTSSLDALAELAAIRDYIVNVQQQLKAGHMPDMTALEQRTADICRIIVEFSANIQQECVGELKDLALQLDDCEKDLRTHFQHVVANMGQDK